MIDDGRSKRWESEEGGVGDDVGGVDGDALWSGTNKNRDVSTRPLARPLARSLAPLTRSFAPH